MYRTFALAAAVAALSVPAFAGDISISLTGKSKAEVVAEIHHAADTVCSEQGYAHPATEHAACVSEVEHDALAQMSSVEKPTKSS